MEKRREKRIELIECTNPKDHAPSHPYRSREKRRNAHTRTIVSQWQVQDSYGCGGNASRIRYDGRKGC